MSRKNVWRRRGRLEFKRVTGRYSDGTLGDWDVLWIRTAKGRKGCRGVSFCDTSFANELRVWQAWRAPSYQQGNPSLARSARCMRELAIESFEAGNAQEFPNPSKE